MTDVKGPPCGHSVCSQHYIDTGATECVGVRLQRTLDKAYGLDWERLIATIAEQQNIPIEEARARFERLRAEWFDMFPVAAALMKQESKDK